MPENSDAPGKTPTAKLSGSNDPPSHAAEHGEQDEPLDQLSPYFREADLPPEGAEPLPMWLWVSIFGILLSGAYYLGANVGDFSPYPWLQHPDEASVSPASAPVSRAVDGAQVYQSRCQACHQAGGEGIAGVYPPLVDSEWVTGEKGVLIRIVLHGMQGEVQVGGEPFNGVMPGWATLSDEELAAVLTHERTSWGNDATQVTVEEVAALRMLLADRTSPWTVAELARAENRTIPISSQPGTTSTE